MEKIKKQLEAIQKGQEKLNKRLDDMGDKLESILSIITEVYVPDRKKEIRDVVQKFKGDPGKAAKVLSARQKARYGNK